MKKFVLSILITAFCYGAFGQTTSLLYTVDAQNDNNQQPVQVNGIEFQFIHKDFRQFLWKKQSKDLGFQWVLYGISISIRTPEEIGNGGVPNYTYWDVFYWHCGESPLEEGQVVTKNYGGKVVQLMVEKIAYFSGYQHNGNEYTECVLPRFVTFRLMVN